ncbi:hypothetical protein Bresa_00650|uniref:HicA-like toxin of HicAB toxin-antitoxin system n=1 Tax=Brenneria salicis ATCC 15712 = DSM 30166 TaxID=714314 RepID=A0A366IAL9_9GAMM|nr:hypothetical protein [Brenneria salicis]NMN90573.1 hypothetical protein [Brenneria salicis ATCC 15712 = DSM 30166]RBP66936.1 hypothetical protein DES54_102147 [Brenneria salicis ATCC 15712 = DSM 30166]RLM32095.1 hypothetical protein BHG07_01560 [Brenneria salicis ATCC 15712 = DSM 30166]
MKKHPNKHIQAAIEYALAQGWRFNPSKGHAFGRLICDTPDHADHMMSIWSTPANPENHAKQIRRQVDHCLMIVKKN